MSAGKCGACEARRALLLALAKEVVAGVGRDADVVAAAKTLIEAEAK